MVLSEGGKVRLHFGKILINENPLFIFHFIHLPPISGLLFKGLDELSEKSLTTLKSDNYVR